MSIPPYENSGICKNNTPLRYTLQGYRDLETENLTVWLRVE
jgi:hypothetical protein